MDYGKRVLRAAVLLVFTAAILFVAGGGRESLDTLFPKKPEEMVGKNGRDSLYFYYSDEALTNYVSKAAVNFGEQKGVYVIPVQIPENRYLEEINRASLMGEKIPDAYIVGNDALEKAYLSGLADQIDDVQEICNTTFFDDTALNAVTYHGKKVAYPLYMDVAMLIYNKTYLQTWESQQEEPKQATLSTMDEILNIADSFDAPEGVEGIMKWNVSDIFYNYWIIGAYLKTGGDTGDDRKILNVDSDQIKNCLKMYQELNQFFYIEADKVTYESVADDFLNGRIVFTIGNTDLLTQIEAAKATGEFPYEYGVSIVPDLNDELKSRTLSVTGTVVVNGYSEHKELANEFAAYLSNEMADELYLQSGKVAACKRTRADGIGSLVAASYESSIPQSKIMEFGDIWLDLEVVFTKVWNGEEPDGLMTELAEQLESKLQPIE